MFIPGSANILRNLSAVTASSVGTQITNGASHVKGSWTKVLDGATLGEAQCDALYVALGRNLNAQMMYVDLAVSNSTPEYAIFAADLAKVRGFALSDFMHYLLPIRVPIIGSGSQDIYARCQQIVSSQTMDVHVVPVYTGIDYGSGGRMVTLGAQTSSNTLGTVVDPGATANAKGSYVQFTSSVGIDVSSISIAMGPNGDVTRSGTPLNIVLDVAYGSAGSECVVIPNYMLSFGSVQDFQPNQLVMPMPCSIPRGSRIAVRAQSNTTGVVGDRQVDVTLYCFGS